RQLLQAGTDAAIGRLERILREAEEPAGPLAVCEAIAAGSQPSELLVEPLLSLLGDPRPGLSDAATRALSGFENARVIQGLSAVASNGPAGLSPRLAAIRALGFHADDIRAIEALAMLARNETNSIQAAATSAMAESTGTTFRTPADAVAWWESNRG